MADPQNKSKLQPSDPANPLFLIPNLETLGLDVSNKPEAISEFQKKMGLQVTGTPDATTATVAEYVRDEVNPSGPKELADSQQKLNSLLKRDVDVSGFYPVGKLTQIESDLKDLGLYKGGETKDFTPELAKAVKQFQEKSGLLQTGSVNEKTLNGMNALAREARDVSSSKDPAHDTFVDSDKQDVAAAFGGRDVPLSNFLTQGTDHSHAAGTPPHNTPGAKPVQPKALRTQGGPSQ